MTVEIRVPLGITEIQSILPHRYPFLFVDKIVEFSEGEKIVGVKNVSCNEGFFAGHFPGRPIMPGVLILEALAQVGAIFVKLSRGKAAEDKLIVFSGVESVRFRRPVEPGDILTLECSNPRHKLVHWKMRAVARVGDKVAAEAVVKATEVN